MVIGFDASRAFIPDRTGTENYSYQMLKALAKIDKINQYIVYVRPGYSSNKVRSKFSLRSNNNVWPNNFQFKEIHWPRFWTQVGLAIQTFRDELDILFVPAHTLPIIRRPRLRTVVTVHDLGSEYLPIMHQFKQRLYLSLMQKYQLKTASKIISVSEATKKDLITKTGIKPDKIRVVHEGYDRKLFKPTKNDVLVNILRQYGLKNREYFLFVGTVQPRKNLTKLIQSFYQFCHPEEEKRPKDLLNENTKLVIAGSKGWMSEEIYLLPKDLGIEDKVKFLGYVQDRDLPALYSGAQALVFPSLFEGFGLPILEAQACGCPVITSNISSMPEVAGKGALLVNPYNIDDIVKGMERVKGKAERGKLIEEGFKNVKRFSWEKCANETLAVLEETTCYPESFATLEGKLRKGYN